ncbi:MAG: CmcJ/NvfI family oxidoreductase [Alphaproteobacteria bacterium]|jgi:hypothetical protein
MHAPTPNQDGALQVQDVVWADLTFILPQDEKPYFESSALTGDQPKVFFNTEDLVVPINDMRPLAHELSVDCHGFELMTFATAVDDLYDDDAIAGVYEAELITLLKAHLGADRAAVFDHTRRSDGVAGAANADGLRGPASRVHVDYTPRSGPQRAKDCLGEDEVDRILGSGGRISQINVWRPINGPVRRTPLAVADASSVAWEELIATDQRFPDRTGEIFQLAHGNGQRWFWAPNMADDEVLLIKGWDSLDDGRARFTPHGAFKLPGQDNNEDIGTPPRESIEARCFLVYEANTV